MSADSPDRPIGDLAVPLPATGRVVTHWPLPIVVQRGAMIFLLLILGLGGAFALLYAVAAGHAQPTVGDVVAGLAAALIWPAAFTLHEVGHAVAGAAVGRPPVWARIAVLPGVALTPPPPERWSRILVSGSGPVLEIGVGVVAVLAGPGTGLGQFLTDPVAMAGGVCILNGAANLLLPWPSFSDGGKLWRAVGQMTRRPEVRTDPASQAPRS